MIGSNLSLPLMSLRVCLECGRATLTFGNSLCKHCCLVKALKALVAVLPTVEQIGRENR